MCHNNPPPPPPPPSDLTHSNSILKTQKQPADSLSLTAPRRKNRTKIRKPKFVSLRLQLFPTHHKHSSPSLSQSNPMNHQQQLNLFPLHPENIVDDKDDMQDEHNVAFLFVSDGAATLNGLLEEDSATTTTTSEEPGLASQFDEENGSSLVRKAMKRRNKEERDGREERWVCYSEVVRKKEMMEEVTSDCSASETTAFGLLSLKLDYEGILNAWSDKGSLYVAGETPQTVPDLRDDVLPHNAANVVWKAWEVEEEGGSNSKSKTKGKEEIGCKVRQREASVLRYKEKRQSRLFSKRIRYEVRKLNAEKRPRMKGRFVKRD